MDNDLKRRLDKIDEDLAEIKALIAKSVNTTAQNFSLLEGSIKKIVESATKKG